MAKDNVQTELARVEAAISGQEGLRGLVSDEQIEAVLASLREKRAGLVAQLKGDGAVAQGDGATALGARALQANNVRHAVTGDNNTFIETQIVNPLPPDPAEVARVRYLRRLRQWCQALPLAVLGGDDGSEVGLDQVYVSLDTERQVALDEGEKRGLTRERAVTALEAATAHKRLVLLGDPGSGKSSFVRQLAAWLAAAELGEVEPPPGWTPLFPLFVVLRELAVPLGQAKLDELTAAKRDAVLRHLLLQQWQQELADKGGAAWADRLEDLLLTGRVLLVFDGLDEVALEVRERVRLGVQAILQAYGGVARVIVTSRIRSYGEGTRLSGFQEERLAPFDEEKIKQFVRGWYGAQAQQGQLTTAQAEGKAAELAAAATAAALRELAANPLLLTTMALIHQREGGLPRERVRLYSQAVELLLTRWQRHKGGEISAALAAVLENGRKLRALMELLAFEAHQLQATRGAGADLSRRDILVLLEDARYLGDVGLVGAFLDYVDQQAGLLVGRGGDVAGVAGGKPPTYSFPHRTFQEYLAGCYLVTGREAGRNYWARAEAGEYWYLAAQLGAEELLFNKRVPQVYLDLAYDLCPESAPADAVAWRTAVWSGHMAVLLGQDEVGRDDKRGGGLAYWQRLELAYGYWLGQYPVTVAQYGLFVADGGYGEAAWWGEAAQAGFWQRGQFKGRYESAWRAAPIDFGEPFGLDNVPVVGVTWYEGLAFGRWLTARWRAAGWLPADWEVVLPSEVEWEKGARGGEQVPTKPVVQTAVNNNWLPGVHLVENGAAERPFPWGDAPLDGSRANWAEAQIGATSTPGCFPANVSPYGCGEMSGNVWEWTRSLWRPYPYEPDSTREELAADADTGRVLRGGSWADNDELALRCAFRDGNLPDDGYFGFRVVVSPFARPTSDL